MKLKQQNQTKEFIKCNFNTKNFTQISNKKNKKNYKKNSKINIKKVLNPNTQKMGKF